MSQFQERILERLIKGESPIQVAQQMNLSEKQVTEALKEAFAIQTEFLQQNAQTVQQLVIEQHRRMYEFAIERAMAEYEVDASPSVGKDGSAKTLKGHLGWFEAAHKVLLAISAVVKPYLNQEQRKAGDLHITIIGGTAAFEKAKHLSHLVGRDMFDVIQGHADDIFNE